MKDQLDLPTYTLDAALEALEGAVLAWEEGGVLSGRAVFRLRLVLEELIGNSFLHGGMTEEGRIDIRVEGNDDALTLTYADTGPPFDPATDLPAPSVSLTLDERPVGELGWVLVRHFFDLADSASGAEGNRFVLKSKPAFSALDPD